VRGTAVWLGGLANPEAYVTATRQSVAQANGWSLEELRLKVTITDDESKPPSGGFNIRGLKLQGGESRDNVLHLSSAILSDLPLTTLWWVRGEEEAGEVVTLPVYLDATRTVMLFTVQLTAAQGLTAHSFYERGVALLASTNLN